MLTENKHKDTCQSEEHHDFDDEDEAAPDDSDVMVVVDHLDDDPYDKCQGEQRLEGFPRLVGNVRDAKGWTPVGSALAQASGRLLGHCYAFKLDTLYYNVSVWFLLYSFLVNQINSLAVLLWPINYLSSTLSLHIHTYVLINLYVYHWLNPFIFMHSFIHLIRMYWLAYSFHKLILHIWIPFCSHLSFIGLNSFFMSFFIFPWLC